MQYPQRLLGLFSLVCLFGLAGCASTGSKESDKPATITIKAHSDINPVSTGQATPTVVTLYQLKDVNAFNSADFFSLYQQPQQTLGADYIASQQWILAPGETRKIKLPIKPDTRFLGVVAAFQQLNPSGWQALMALTTKRSKPAFSIELTKTTLQFVK